MLFLFIIVGYVFEVLCVLIEVVGCIVGLWYLFNVWFGVIIGLLGFIVLCLWVGCYQFEFGSKLFELVQYLLWLFCLFDSWLGQDDEVVCLWLVMINFDFVVWLLDLLLMIWGLLLISDYVDVFRVCV